MPPARYGVRFSAQLLLREVLHLDQNHEPPSPPTGERQRLSVPAAEPCLLLRLRHLPHGHVHLDQLHGCQHELQHGRHLYRAGQLQRTLAGSGFPQGARQHDHHRGGQRPGRLHFLAVGRLGDLSHERRRAELFPRGLLSARRHRLRGGHGGLEMDVQQLLRHFQLPAQGRRYH